MSSESFFNTDEIYDVQFKKTYKFVKSGLTGDIKKDSLTLRNTIQTLFDYQGLDWIGRGESFLIKNQATIAATEAVLFELEEQYHKQ